MKLENKIKALCSNFRMYFNIAYNGYRSNEPSMYFYKLILCKHKKKNLSCLLNEKKDFFSLVFVTLDSWNMNDRAARINTFGKFKKNILNQRNNLLNLEEIGFCSFEENKNAIREIFDNINVSNKKRKIVANSKTLHFILPNLFIPIDGKFTMNFFGKSGSNFPTYSFILSKFIEIYKYKKIVINNIQKQIFKEIKLVLPITKIIDHAIIGYAKYNFKLNNNLNNCLQHKISKHHFYYLFKYDNKGNMILKGFSKV